VPQADYFQLNSKLPGGVGPQLTNKQNLPGFIEACKRCFSGLSKTQKRQLPRFSGTKILCFLQKRTFLWPRFTLPKKSADKTNGQGRYYQLYRNKSDQYTCTILQLTSAKILEPHNILPGPSPDRGIIPNVPGFPDSVQTV